ncbi:helix-turn-helix domain-containing protein [Chryseobacterium sp. CKR4-1]|uniref:helix-turn-helix domain-containing protein n=1 Tax=Chryseobacterium sp. CKR4-1 TaxID=3068896 RepID=UPI0027B9434D|nr:helix-turn-helix domain-containing protein [Chryseobacterium sp. CKR4-1]
MLFRKKVLRFVLPEKSLYSYPSYKETMKRKALKKELRAIAGQLQKILLILDKEAKQTISNQDVVENQKKPPENRMYIIDNEQLLNNQDVCRTLQVSRRSLQRYRSSGKLRYYMLGGRTYYKLSDVHQFMRDGLSHPIEESVRLTL